MITLHHLNNSRSQRILWLLEELGLKYELKRYERDSKTMLAPHALKRIHPLGKSPILEDDGRILIESGAIIEYILDRYGEDRLRPRKGTDERLRYDLYMHFAEGSLMPPLLLSLVVSKLSKSPVPLPIRPIGAALAMGIKAKFLGPQLKTHFDFIESELSKREWFAGPEFTAADIQMSFPIEAGEGRLGYEKRPHLRTFLEKIHARPAYKRALEIGGPYSLSL